MQKLTHVILTMIYIYIYIYLQPSFTGVRSQTFAIGTEERTDRSHSFWLVSTWSTYMSESSDPTPRMDQSKPANRAFYSPQPFSRIRALSLTGLLPLSPIIRAREVWRYINIGRWSLLGDVRSFVSVFETFLDRARLFYFYNKLFESFSSRFYDNLKFTFNFDLIRMVKKKKKNNNYTFLWIGKPQFYK